MYPLPHPSPHKPPATSLIDCFAKTQILSTGQVPLSAPLRGLGVPEPELLTPSGHVQVKRTLQLPRAPHVFALGDVADTGDQKAARPAWPQAHVIAENVWRLHMHKSAGRAGEPELMEHRPLPAGIRMSLGFVSASLLWLSWLDTRIEGAVSFPGTQYHLPQPAVGEAGCGANVQSEKRRGDRLGSHEPVGDARP